MNWNWLRPRIDSGACLCGHRSSDHEQHCGRCGRGHCDTYRPIWVTDPNLSHLVELAWLNTVHGRQFAIEQDACTIQRRGGLILLVHVVAARILDRDNDIVTRSRILDDIAAVGRPAWLLTAHALGEHREIRRRLGRLTPGEQRWAAIDLLRYAARQEVAR